MGYIPTGYFDTLASYMKTSNSPLFNQTGIAGQLAAQINTAFPLAAASDPSATTSTTESGSGSSNRTRDIIIGVCVSVGGILWIGLVYWIYKRVRRSNDQAVHRRLSEHMSMFSDRRAVPDQNRNFVDPQSGWDDRRQSASSIAASEIDDRPSSFYASPVDHERPMRQRQGGHPASYVPTEDYSYPGSLPSDGDISPNRQSVFGGSWFQNPVQPAGQPASQPQRVRMSQNPFEDMATRSYLNTSGSTGLNPAGLSTMAQRRSGMGMPRQVQKGMISGPTLQATSLEFRE